MRIITGSAVSAAAAAAADDDDDDADDDDDDDDDDDVTAGDDVATGLSIACPPARSPTMPRADDAGATPDVAVEATAACAAADEAAVLCAW